MLELKFDSTECRRCGRAPATADGIIVKTRTDAENYYCLNCWYVVEADFPWAGVIGILVINPPASAAAESAAPLIHRLLGSRFNWLITTEQGIVLQGNETFIEQPSLF